MLKEISIRADLKEEKELKHSFPNAFFSTQSISRLFLRHLTTVNHVKYVQITVVMVNKVDMHGKTEIFGNQIDIFFYTNFENLHNTKKIPEKRLFILNILRDSFIEFSNIIKIKNEEINNAYKKCIDDGITYRFYYKGKLFRSFSRNYFIGLIIFYDINKYEITQELYDGKKNLLNKKIIYTDKGDYYYLEKVFWQKEKDIFCYKFDSVKKLFCNSINEILSSDPSETFINHHKYFK